MALKIGSWLVGAGCFFAITGLCFLPAAFGLHKDIEVLTAGGVLFSTGMVLAASGMYMKARHWAQGMPIGARLGKKGVPKLCSLCSKHEALIQCRVHKMQLCADCLAKHYDFRECAYVPSVPQAASRSKAHSHASGA